MTECPQCHLPTEDDAWACDGCGLEFRKDFAVIRTELLGKLRSTQLALVWTVISSLVAIGGVVLLALNGYYYISIPLVLGIFGAFAAVFHRRSVLKEHLALLERRYKPLPAATVRQD